MEIGKKKKKKETERTRNRGSFKTEGGVREKQRQTEMADREKNGDKLKYWQTKTDRNREVEIRRERDWD